MFVCLFVGQLERPFLECILNWQFELLFALQSLVFRQCPSKRDYFCRVPGLEPF